jgi:hypothetical protein
LTGLLDDAEVAGDLLVELSLDEALEHLAFAHAEGGEALLVDGELGPGLTIGDCVLDRRAHSRDQDARVDRAWSGSRWRPP